MQGPEFDIAKNIKAIEWLKAELADALAKLYKALLKGTTEGVLDLLAFLIINAFLLAKRLGLGFGRLEAQVLQRTKAMLKEKHPLEEWYGDLTSLKDYFEMKR